MFGLRFLAPALARPPAGSYLHRKLIISPMLTCSGPEHVGLRVSGSGFSSLGCLNSTCSWRLKTIGDWLSSAMQVHAACSAGNTIHGSPSPRDLRKWCRRASMAGKERGKTSSLSGSTLEGLCLLWHVLGFYEGFRKPGVLCLGRGGGPIMRNCSMLGEYCGKFLEISMDGLQGVSFLRSASCTGDCGTRWTALASEGASSEAWPTLPTHMTPHPSIIRLREYLALARYFECLITKP